MGHGWEGVVLKLMRGKDFRFTVTGSEAVGDRYHRVHFTDGGMLAQTGTHPTMWVRVWFGNAGKPHQRAYTLVDPDPAQGTFSLEFALHPGPACDWARAARPGDTVDATLQGTGFTAPTPCPAGSSSSGTPPPCPRSTPSSTPSPTPRRPSSSRPATPPTSSCRSVSTPGCTNCAPSRAPAAVPVWWPR